MSLASGGSIAVRPEAKLLLRILQNVELSLRVIEGITEFHTQLLSWKIVRSEQRLPEVDQPLRQATTPAKRIMSAVNLTPENRLLCRL